MTDFSTPLTLLYVSDGKAGHVAQARGLHAALERQGVPVHWQELPVALFNWLDWLVLWWNLLCRLLGLGNTGLVRYSVLEGLLESPDGDSIRSANPTVWIIGVGHRTHWAVLLLTARHAARHSLILMKPSLPLSWFDRVILPRHDWPEDGLNAYGQIAAGQIADGILLTEGVLNPLIDRRQHDSTQWLILIGGPSKRHGWDAAALNDQLRSLAQWLQTHAPNAIVTLSTSRRTPPQWLGMIQALPEFHYWQCLAVEETPPGWLAQALDRAGTVWVTEDSVSMVYEALTAGCQVGLLGQPRLKADRITRSMDWLIQDTRVQTLKNLQTDNSGSVCIEMNVPPLNEADRAARWLLAQPSGKRC